MTTSCYSILHFMQYRVEYNKHNTFLVDDSETHYNQNIYNCYLIKPFEVNVEDNSHKDDIELLRIIKYFRK